MHDLYDLREEILSLLINVGDMDAVSILKECKPSSICIVNSYLEELEREGLVERNSDDVWTVLRGNYGIPTRS